MVAAITGAARFGVVARLAECGATSSVHASTTIRAIATALSVGVAGGASVAARHAARVDAGALETAGAATALSVGGAVAGIGLALIRGATLAVGADSSATALSVGVAGATVRYTHSNAGAARGVEDLALGAAGRDTASVAQHLTRRTLTLTRRAVVGLSRNFGAGGFGEVGSATRLRRTREARPLPFRALAYTLRLLWSIRTEEALTELGTATLATLGGPCHPWEGGQRTPYEGGTHQPERLTSRNAAISQSSSQLVEGAVGSILAHLCPPIPRV